MKSEPHVYSIDDLKNDGKTHWDGVRNYQARNFMRDQMKVGDRILYYHSNAKPPGVVGTARIVKEGYPDFTAWDPDDPHYDPKSRRDQPRWYMVDIEFTEKFDRMITLEEIKSTETLQNMVLLRRSRLSVQPVEPDEFAAIVGLSRKPGRD